MLYSIASLIAFAIAAAVGTVACSLTRLMPNGLGVLCAHQDRRGGVMTPSNIPFGSIENLSG